MRLHEVYLYYTTVAYKLKVFVLNFCNVDRFTMKLNLNK